MNNRMMNLFTPKNKKTFQDTGIMPVESPLQQPQQFLNFQQPVETEAENPEIENESLRRFLGLEMPERTNPSLLSKIGASLYSLKANPQQVDQALNAPYYQKMADYKLKADPLLEGAKIESQQNNYRSLGNYRDTQAKTAQTRANTGVTNAETGRMRVENQIALAGMPNIKIREGKNGQPDIWYDSKSGKEIARTESGSIDPVTKYKMEQEGRIDLAGMNNDAAMDRTVQSGKDAMGRVIQQGVNSQNNIAANTAGQIEIKGSPSGSTTGRNLQPTQAKQLLLNNVQNFKLKNPALGKWITVDPNTDEISITEPGTNWRGNATGPTQKEYLEIQKALLEVPVTGMPPKQPGMEALPGPTNVTPVGGNNPAPNTDKRARAIAALQKANKLVNEETIAAVMARMK